MKIPPNGQWTQTNDGDIFGVLHETHNIYFDKKGEAKLSRKALALVDSGTSGFGEVLSIVYFDGDYHIVTDEKVFLGSLDLDNFSAVGSSPDLGSVSDGLVVFDRLYVSDTTALAYLNTSGSWTTGIGSLTATYPHPLGVFDSLPTYKLAVGDGNTVKTYDSSGNLNPTTLTIPSNYLVTSLVYKNGYLYIGTKEINGREAAVFLWNGDGTAAQYKVDVGASWVYSMTPYRGLIALVTNEGEVLALNGASVQQLATFPVFHVQGARWEAGNSTRGKVYNRGMIAIGDSLYINASGRVEVGSVPEMKSGVWCFDPGVGLYHYASPSTDLWTADSGITISSSVITTSTTHNLKTGDMVTFSAISGITGISAATPYYAIVESTTTLKISGSRQGAFDGTYITLSGTATSDTMNYAPNTDFGDIYQADSGAIAVCNYLDTPDPLFGTDILFGSEMKNNADAEKDVLCVLSSRYNEGSFTTQKLYTDNISQVWKSIYTFINGIVGDDEKIIVKYRDADSTSLPSTPVAITWSSSTVFTTTDPAVKSLLSEGHEVRFIQGRGQGRCAHVTAISTSVNTTEVTVDESYGSAGATGDVMFTNFKKIDTVTNARTQSAWSKSTADTKNNWIELRVEPRGFEPAVQIIDLTNSSDQNAV